MLNSGVPLRRTLKNVVKNYSDAQVKVREATSNDPWGPSSTIMMEIADLTYNVLAFNEIMQMIWKRLNDHGKNWRHVYKSLVLLDYIVKTGSEKVALQCKENLFTIQTLKDFQYIEDTKDHGQSIREKAKQLASLLKDTDRLKNERTKALKSKERFAKINAGVGNGPVMVSTSPVLSSIISYPENTVGKYSELCSPSSWSLDGVASALDAELEAVRPTSSGEEELQLQLAIAMSKEEHKQELCRMKGDEVKLQMALEQSRKEATANSMDSPFQNFTEDVEKCQLGTAQGFDPWQVKQSDEVFNATFMDNKFTKLEIADPGFPDPWNSKLDDENNVWPSSTHSLPPVWDIGFQPKVNNYMWHNSRNYQNSPNFISGECNDEVTNIQFTLKDSDPWDQSNLNNSNRPHSSVQPLRSRTPKDFLGENAGLIDLENLMSRSTVSSLNPFVPPQSSLCSVSTSNPFIQLTPTKISTEIHGENINFKTLKSIGENPNFSTLFPSSDLSNGQHLFNNESKNLPLDESGLLLCSNGLTTFNANKEIPYGNEFDIQLNNDSAYTNGGRSVLPPASFSMFLSSGNNFLHSDNNLTSISNEVGDINNERLGNHYPQEFNPFLQN